MKFPVADFRPVIIQLEAWHAQRDAPLQEEDHYYNAPDRDFARTDEALRLRCIGRRNIATYKGPKEPGPTKTRKEIEVPLADGPEAAQLFCRFLEALGYRAVAIVRKKRVSYHFQKDGFALQACLDEVEEVGSFVEVEIVTQPEAKAQAQETLQAVAAALALKDVERRSYLGLLLDKRGQS
jgi:adenylate cyclase class 2